MKKNICLICYESLESTDNDYHSLCSRKFFGSDTAPALPYKLNEIEKLAGKIIRSHITLTGAQAKLSLSLDNDTKSKDTRFTIVGLWGKYILKPPSVMYKSLPENEDITMHLAESVGIKTVPHALIRLKSGEFSYITKRIDRDDRGNKIPFEDMAQLTERLTEDKYKGSYEQIANVTKRYTTHHGLAISRFFELILFSFLTGNADMHLKNFSLISESESFVDLAPAYDLLSTKLVIPNDKDEMALSLNGKKRKITNNDFYSFGNQIGLTKKVIDNIISIQLNSIKTWEKLIYKSFLSKTLQKKFISIIHARTRIMKNM